MAYNRRTTLNADLPHYERIAADLARRLEQGEWREGARFPSRRTLARKYDVGERTVRRALEILRERGRLLIRPRSSTRATLASSVNEIFEQALAVVLPRVVPTNENEIAGLMWRGICQGAQRAGCPLIVLQHPARWRTHFAAGLRHLPIAGVILQAPLRPLLTEQYEDLGKPVVLLDQPVEGRKLGCVCVDNHAAAFDATARMIALGHHCVAFVQPVVSSMQRIDPDSNERRAGFLAACHAARLPPANVHVLTVYRTETVIYDKIFKKDSQITGLLCSTTYHAQMSKSIAMARGYRIPRDLSIVTFRGNQKDHEPFSGPVIDFELMGRLAVTDLFKVGPQPTTRRVPTRWMDGSTLAAPSLRRV